MKTIICKLAVLFLLLVVFNKITFCTPINAFIDNVIPNQNSINVNRTTDIRVVFVGNMNASTINNAGIKVFGQQTGILTTSISYNAGTKTVTINPVNDFKSGEKVHVILNAGIKTAADIPIDPISFSFTAQASGGNAIFTEVSNPEAGDASVRQIISGDLDNDQDLDLCACYENKIAIMKNDGQGVFQASPNVISVANYHLIISFCVGDFDADGDLDLALTNFNNFNYQTELCLYKNDGAGTFTQYAPANPFNGYILKTDDMDSDGDLDIVSPDTFIPFPGIGGVMTFVNDGLGNFINSGEQYPNFCCPPMHGETISYWALTLDDYNNDGRVDFITGGYMSSLQFPCTCSFTQVFGSFGVIDISPSIYSIGTSLSEAINNDPYMDFIQSNGHIYKNDNLTFTESSFPGHGGFIVTGDFEGDGDLDIAEQFASGSNLNVFTNNSDGIFTPFSSRPAPFSGEGIASGDFDSDGDIDIATTGRDAGRLAIYLNGCGAPECNITGVTPLIVYTVDNLFVSSVESGFWDISNYDNTNASISSGQNNDSVKINAGNVPGHFVLYYNGQDSCGHLTILSLRHVFVEALLPVELISFNSDVNKNNVMLHWVTSSEKNNFQFEIERCSVNPADVCTWNRTGVVPGKGNTTDPTDYFFEDRNLPTGRYSYRIKQIDFNGNFEYYELPNEVMIEVQEFSLSQNYPNPFNPVTTIDYQLAEDGIVSLDLFDIAGRKIMTMAKGLQKTGYYHVRLDGANLSSSIYYYRLEVNSKGKLFVKTMKMLLIK